MNRDGRYVPGRSRGLSFEALQLLTNVSADRHLRIRGRFALLRFALPNQGGRLLEGVLHGLRRGNRVFQEGLAEVREISLIIAAEAAVVCVGGRDDESIVAPQGIRENT